MHIIGTEVIRYTQLGKEDIRFGTGTFEVVLADGRKVVLNEVDMLALSSAIIATGTTTGRTLQNRFADTVHVKDFGASSTTTAAANATAIQAALDSTGGEVRLPAGEILPYSSTITNTTGASVVGCGSNSDGTGSALLYTGTGTAWIHNVPASTKNAGRYAHFKLYADPPYATIGLSVVDANGLVIDNVAITGFLTTNGAGIELAPTGAQLVLSTSIQHSKIESNWDNIRIAGTNGLTNHTVITGDNKIRASQNANIISQNQNYSLTISDNDLEGSGLYGIYLKQTESLVINGNYFEETSTTAIPVWIGDSSNQYGLVLQGNFFQAPAGSTAPAVRLGKGGGNGVVRGLVAGGNTFWSNWATAYDILVQGGTIGTDWFGAGITPYSVSVSSSGLSYQSATEQTYRGITNLAGEVVTGTPGTDALLVLQNHANNKAFYLAPRDISGAGSFDLAIDYYTGAAWARAGYVDRTNGALHWESPLYIPVIATASLPAAGASNDGRLIIEDGGAGDRNFIIYGGGQRFRVDGGAAF